MADPHDGQSRHGQISSMGELICDRQLAQTETGFVPGQHHARILDPRPHRDRADLAAILTYVDDEGRACNVTCLRYRDNRGWHPVILRRAGLRKSERSTAVGCPKLEGELLEVIEAAAVGADPFPFEEPSSEEQAMRRLAHNLIEQASS